MTAEQYKTTTKWTANQIDAEHSNDSLYAVRASLSNMGLYLPNGSYDQILEMMMSNDYLDWRACTAEAAQKLANDGYTVIGINRSASVMILPEGTETEMENVPYAFTVEEIPSDARLTMQYYAYGSSNTPHNVPILICYQTKNDCYKAAKSIGTIKGIVVHSTGGEKPNPTLKRYVDYPEKLGENIYGNHWNQSGVEKMVHAFIGLDKYNEVKVVQTLPYSYACWGVGSGVNGSYNYHPNGHIQFEICEDLTDYEYYKNAFNVAIRYCAYLCKRFNLSKNSIVSHKEAAELGYGSNHGDPDHWLEIYGLTMDQFRLAVYNELRY